MYKRQKQDVATSGMVNLRRSKRRKKTVDRLTYAMQAEATATANAEGEIFTLENLFPDHGVDNDIYAMKASADPDTAPKRDKDSPLLESMHTIKMALQREESDRCKNWQDQ